MTVLRLPTHVQGGFLANFMALVVQPACTAVDGAAGVSAAAQQSEIQQWTQQINENWAPRLEELAVQALEVSIDSLLLEMVPLASLEPDHPVNALLRSQSVTDDLNTKINWYNAAYRMFEKLSERLNSDDANLTRVWAAGPKNHARVCRVLGNTPHFNLYEGYHNIAAAAARSFVKQGDDVCPTATGTQTRDVEYRLDRETFPLPILKLKPGAP